jgi:hypothetical protein
VGIGLKYKRKKEWGSIVFG